MSVLHALDAYYHRMAADGAVEAPGWGRSKFGWCVTIGADGEPIDVIDLHDLDAKKRPPRLFTVPAEVKRTVGIKPNRFWDKSAYSLGRTAGEGRRTALEHAAFAHANLALIGDSDDPGLAALRAFLTDWTPDRFDAAPFRPEMLDANIMFRLDGDGCYLHQRPAARALLDAGGPADARDDDPFCLIGGTRGPLARLHPTVKGVEGAQSSGAALVSFNLDAFSSYGKTQGANAPTSEGAAFRYGAALNRLLTRDGPNRVKRPIGDATVVFWADASSAVAAQAGEAWFAAALSPPDDIDEARQVGDQLAAVAAGRPLAELRPDIEPGTRFHVLGLSPNAARLSVRFWLSDTLDAFALRLANHHADLALEPSPWANRAPPAVNRLLVETVALGREFKNIPPLLAGEVMRAVLSGGRYPQSWMAAAMIRLRAGDDPLTGWHAAAIRAVLRRDHRLLNRKDAPMSLSPEEPNEAYQLGRLFAVLETAQRMALGRINATIRDRYFGAASATPAGVFPLLLRGAQNHLGKLRKLGKGGWLEREIETILDRLTLDLPRSLPLAEQGRFAIGYYHQRKAQFAGRPDIAAEIESAETAADQEETN